MTNVITTPALVVGGFAYGDYHKVLTLLTAHQGCVTALARGVLSPRSTLAGVAQPLGYHRVGLIPPKRQQTGGGWFTVHNYHTLAAWPALHTSLNSLACALHWAEWLERWTQHHSDHAPAVLGLGVEGLVLLNQAAGLAASPTEALAYLLACQWCLLHQVGMAPNLTHWVDTQTPCNALAQPEQPQVFSLAWGGLLAQPALHKAQQPHVAASALRLRPATVAALLDIGQQPAQLTPPLCNTLLALPWATLTNLQRLLRVYAQHHLGQGFKSQGFLCDTLGLATPN
jgi:recombinational DNA repair protein (RecF pathway)